MVSFTISAGVRQKEEKYLFTDARLMVGSVDSSCVNTLSIQAKGNIPTYPQCSTSLLMLPHLKQTLISFQLYLSLVWGKSNLGSPEFVSRSQLKFSHIFEAIDSSELAMAVLEEKR